MDERRWILEEKMVDQPPRLIYVRFFVSSPFLRLLLSLKDDATIVMVEEKRR